jgi:hypothetical protein
MTDNEAGQAKIFTVEEANACLPLVRVIVADLMQLSRELIDRRRRLDQLTAGRELDKGDVYGDELAQVEDELSKDAERLQGFQDEITQLGAEPKDPVEGLVDFPAILERRFVYLCWKYDEPEVLHWHELEAGFAGRQPLTATSIADGGDTEHGDALDP